RVAADQHRRSRDDPAADRPVELGEAAWKTRRKSCRGFQADQRDHLPAALEVVLGRKNARYFSSFLHERVPFGAVGALALPAGRDRSAGLTDVTRLNLRHARSLAEQTA